MPPRWHAKFVRQKSESPSSNEEAPNLSLEEEVNILKNDHHAHKYRTGFNRPRVKNRSFLLRELGNAAASINLKDEIRRQLSSWRSWTGASKDILSVAWGPAGYFAAAAGTNHADSSDLPYNKANNLLFGRVDGYESRLGSLTGHSLRRANADQSWNADPDLHMTVSHVTFSQHAPVLYSSGYDKTVRIWDLPSNEQQPAARCRTVLRHDNGVDILSLRRSGSAADKEILATAQRSAEYPIRIYDVSPNSASQEQQLYNLVSARSSQFRLHPSAIEWGPCARTRNWLLAGFTEFSSPTENRSDREGDVCVWNIERPGEPMMLHGATDSVFSVAWSPSQFVMATASAARNPAVMANRNETRSVIKTWSPAERPSRIFELECPAFDINDVQFHPWDSNIITASCTDGRIYVWDIRNASEIALVLEHGNPIETYLEPFEEHDVGIRFTSWGCDGRYLFTGGSDGRIACWDALVSPSDALAQEVAQLDSGVMAASFSPDGSKLLIGTVKGSVEVLSVGAVHKEEEFGSAVNPTELCADFDSINITVPHGSDQMCEGQEASKVLVLSGQLEHHPKYGVGQGPNYSGPWKKEAHIAGDPSLPLLPEFAAQQFDKSIRRAGRRDGGTTAVISIRAHRDAAAIAHEKTASKHKVQISKEMKAAALLDEILDEENAAAEIGAWIGEDVEETYEDLMRYARATELAAATQRKRVLEGGNLPERKKSRELSQVSNASRATLQSRDPSKENGAQRSHSKPVRPAGTMPGSQPFTRITWDRIPAMSFTPNNSQGTKPGFGVLKPTMPSNAVSQLVDTGMRDSPLKAYVSAYPTLSSASFPQDHQPQSRAVVPNGRPATASNVKEQQSSLLAAQNGEKVKTPSTPRKNKTPGNGIAPGQSSPTVVTPRSRGQNGFIVPPRVERPP